MRNPFPSNSITTDQYPGKSVKTRFNSRGEPQAVGFTVWFLWAGFVDTDQRRSKARYCPSFPETDHPNQDSEELKA